jgi:flagellar assembly protein FliH
MNNQRVLEQGKVEWFSDENSRLNYQMIFSEQVAEEEQPESTMDMEEVLARRDQRWKNKLEAARKEAYQRGMEEGYDQGIKEAEEVFTEKLHQFRSHFEQSQQYWMTLQSQLSPGVLDLAFDIAEQVLGIPVENPKIREHLEEQLLPLFRKLDDRSKSVIYVCAADMEYIEELYQQYAPELPLRIVAREDLKPGEFSLETPGAKVISDFKAMLQDFKETLTLPTWKA